MPDRNSFRSPAIGQRASYQTTTSAETDDDVPNGEKSGPFAASASGEHLVRLAGGLGGPNITPRRASIPYSLTRHVRYREFTMPSARGKLCSYSHLLCCPETSTHCSVGATSLIGDTTREGAGTDDQ